MVNRDMDVRIKMSSPKSQRRKSEDYFINRKTSNKVDQRKEKQNKYHKQIRENRTTDTDRI